MKELIEIQSSLKAPKGQRNNFGKYNYRSCEDILEAVKPLLKNAFLTLSDDVVQVGDRIYVKATATLRVGEDTISVTAMAREAMAQKGMSDPQITGSASSYARKYALNGLFAIDDTKDDDATNNHQQPTYTPPANKPPVQQQQQAPAPAPTISKDQLTRLHAIANGIPVEQIKAIIAKHGFTSSKLITTFKYTEICLEIEGLKK